MKKNIFNLLFLVGAIFFGGSLFAQTITGVVSDTNGALPGVNVVVKGTTIGTATDFDGKFSLENVNPKVFFEILK